MLEYIFFDDELAKKFSGFLVAHQQSFSQHEDPMGIVIAVDTDEDDPFYEEMDVRYDQLMDEQSVLLDHEDGSGMSVCALTAQLADGSTVYAKIPQEMLNRLLSVVTAKELGGLVDAIASAVESRDTNPLCKR
jgi:hypothetical protein